MGPFITAVQVRSLAANTVGDNPSRLPYIAM